MNVLGAGCHPNGRTAEDSHASRDAIKILTLSVRFFWVTMSPCYLLCCFADVAMVSSVEKRGKREKT